MHNAKICYNKTNKEELSRSNSRIDKKRANKLRNWSVTTKPHRDLLLSCIIEYKNDGCLLITQLRSCIIIWRWPYVYTRVENRLRRLTYTCISLDIYLLIWMSEYISINFISFKIKNYISRLPILRSIWSFFLILIQLHIPLNNFLKDPSSKTLRKGQSRCHGWSQIFIYQSSRKHIIRAWYYFL